MADAPTVLITGASRGIGTALAEHFARDGYRLILSARDEDSLRHHAEDLSARYHCEALAIAADLASPQGPDRLLEKIRERDLTITSLVNNAGFGLHGHFVDLPLDRQMDMIQLNIASLTKLTHLLLPELLASGRGELLNVASIASFLPGTYMGTYFATKAFVLHFTEALAGELAERPIRITCLCPGVTKTSFIPTAGMQKNLFLRWAPQTAEQVAAAGYRALKKSQRVCTPGLVYKVLQRLIAISPRSLTLKLIGPINGRPSDPPAPAASG